MDLASLTADVGDTQRSGRDRHPAPTVSPRTDGVIRF